MGTFSGPAVVNNSVYNYHICTTSGTFTPYFTGNVEVLVVAGGGGGGMDMGGGGGGGGVLTSTSYAVTSNSPITVTVGAGGVGAPAGGPPSNSNQHAFTISATSGSNSVFGSLTAVGGGYGGSSYFGYTPNYGYGANGGSGGGSSGYSDGNGGHNGTGTAGQGSAGGASLGQYYSGGGGGAGAVGQQNPPHGGAGLLNTILGKSYYWGGGGGGAAYSTGVGGNGGAGGGGGGASAGLGDTTGLNPGYNAGAGGGGDWVDTPGGNGGQYTGGGGGGGMHYCRSNRGGNGGSGIVIIRYPASQGTSTFNGAAASPNSSLLFEFDAGNLGKGLAVEVLVVAGGGGGGMDMGGGGGGGQAISTNSIVQIGTAVTVTVGAAGAGSPGTYGATPAAGGLGGLSRFGSITALGGGGGGSGHYYPYPYVGAQGQAGGNAGGDSPLWGRNRGNGQLALSNGYEGGAAGYNGDGSYTAGGGGGASQPGWGGRGTWRAGNGGDGLYSAINGTGYYWGGGGGGACYTSTAGAGGAGGGGGGSAYSGGAAGSGGSGLNTGTSGTVAVSAAGGNGGTNTGGGGGGGTHSGSVGGNGGSGIVIVRYYGSQKATGGTITSAGGYTVHTFTTSGTFTPTSWLGANDISSNGITTTVIGPTYSSTNGGMLTFNGSSDKVVTSSGSIISGTQDYTVEAAIRRTALNTTDFIFGNYGSGNSGGLEFYVANNVLYNYIAGYVAGATTISANQWYYVGVTRSGNTITLYVNGVSDGTGTLATSIATTNPYTIGNGYDYTSEAFVGDIALVKVYNRALTAAEVQQNFNAIRGRFGI